MSVPRVDDASVTRLALAARTGDRTAATAFIESTQHDVHRFLAYLVDAAEADDLTQETYLRVMRALPRFAGRSTARTWLLAIARRVAADHLRAAARRPRPAGLEDWEAAADAVTARRHADRFDERIALRQLLNDLPEQQREAFIATQVLGLSYAEAAEVCGCPVGTIRSRVARARDELVTAMRETPASRSRSAVG